MDQQSGQTPDSGQVPAGEFVTAREAASRLGVNERTIRRAIRRGDLPAIKRSGWYRISGSALVTFRAGTRSRPQPATPTGIASPRPDLSPPLADGPLAPRALPRPITSFVGRAREVAEVVALVRGGSRLITVTGPGGVGKTRLAVQVATLIAPEFVDGVAFVDLAAVTDHHRVLPTIALVLGVRVDGERPLLTRLAALLANRRLLIVLDNLEHLVDAGPRLIDLLTACSEARVIVTSRVVLRLSGEQVYPLGPLAIPERSQSLVPSDAVTHAAVALFVARALAANPAFTLTTEHTATVVEIVYRLDGLPLAIELAAAWVRSLPPATLLTLLTDRLNLLTGGARDLPARQRTMRDTIAWSYNLLRLEDQALFRRLAVFAGGFTLNAAAMCTGLSGDHVLAGIATLVDTSLLRVIDGQDGEPRYLMLETVREFGLEQLAATGEADDMRDRHAAWCLACGQRLARASGAMFDDLRWLRRVEAELDNARTALGWLHQTNRAAEMLTLAVAFQPLWDLRGGRDEAIAWLEQGMVASGDLSPAARCQVLGWLGRHRERQGQFVRATALHEARLDLARQTGDAREEGQTLHALGVLALHRNHCGAAKALIEAARAAYQRAGDDSAAGLTGYVLGVVAYAESDFATALDLVVAAVRWRREHGYVANLAVPLNLLGLIASEQGDWPRAAGWLAESLDHWGQDRVGNREVLAEWLAAVARLEAGRGRASSAALLYGAAETLTDAAGVPLVVPPDALYRRHVAAMQAALGDDAFTAAWLAGRGLTSTQAIEQARAAIAAAAVGALRAPVGGAKSDRLSPREHEVLGLVAAGQTDREIAATLFIGRRTVNTHVASVLAKLGATGRRDAMVRARERGLLPGDDPTSI